MHEMSIMQGIFDIVTENIAQHRLNKVTAVNVVVGELSGVKPAALEFAFQCFAQGTLAEGAEFTITRVPVTGRCRRCSIEMTGITGLSCNCHQPPDYEMLTGTELYVDSITGDNQGEDLANAAD